jgi:hypothetical protein
MQGRNRALDAITHCMVRRVPSSTPWKREFRSERSDPIGFGV